MRNAGGGLAEGVIAYEGRRLAADTIVSFDGKAVMLLENKGISARLLASYRLPPKLARFPRNI